MKAINNYLLTAATIVVAFCSCSEDTLLTDAMTEEEEYTMFSAGLPAPEAQGKQKTSADKDRNFYWTVNDHIWVLNNVDNKYYHSHKAELEDDNRIGHFKVHGVFSAPSYPVFYIGQASPSAPDNVPGINENVKRDQLKVRIAAQQTQSKVNNADHYAVSGDCGTGTATPAGGTDSYGFQLAHKAAYLMIYPYKDNSLTQKHFILDKITIKDKNTTVPLAGVFNFDINGLSNSGVQEGSQEITLRCGDKGTGFPVLTTNSMDVNGSYVVINPGSHQLEITYHLYDVNHNYRAVTKTLTPYDFKENGVSKIHHKLTPDPEFPDVTWYDVDIYFRWDAQSPSSGHTSPKNAAERQNEGAAPLEATRSCKNMPNANEMWWYVENGDPRWDNAEHRDHAINRVKTKDFNTGKIEYEDVYLRGVWLKRKSVILNSTHHQNGTELTKCGHSSHSGNGPTFCSDHAGFVDPGTGKMIWVDYRTYVFPEGTSIEPTQNRPLVSASYQTGGRPSDAERDNYFFLPALGHLGSLYGIPQPSITGFEYNKDEGFYWTSTPLQEKITGTINPINNTEHAFYLHFTSSFFTMHANQHRSQSYVAGDGWFH